MNQLEEALGYRFSDGGLLERACRHASSTEERTCSNERLEFLGDAVLALVVAEEFYRHEPVLDEGAMTQMRALCVSGEALAEAAHKHGLQNFLKVGKNMEEIPERVLAGFVEALIAAVYLDGGLDAARAVVMRLLGERINHATRITTRKDYKSLLQEWALRHCAALPQYRVLKESGPPHQRSYTVAAVVCGKEYQPAEGRSKKEAEQRAALNALLQIGLLKKENHHGDS